MHRDRRGISVFSFGGIEDRNEMVRFGGLWRATAEPRAGSENLVHTFSAHVEEVGMLGQELDTIQSTLAFGLSLLKLSGALSEPEFHETTETILIRELMARAAR